MREVEEIMFETVPYKHPLVIGAGGGNDIVSATLVVADLDSVGIRADLAGMCSPGAVHKYGANDEEPINTVTADTSRFRPSKKLHELSFIDAKVPELLRQEKLERNVYNLSCLKGTTRLEEELTKLVEKEKYDGIIAVDIGGDILARGKQDPTILSPLMDFSLLYVLGQMTVPSMLVEFGLQTDGELRPKGCTEIFDELKKDGLIKSVSKITKDDPAVRTFKRIYDGVKGIRQGHTATMTLKTLENDKDIFSEYRSRLQVLDKKWQYSFPITLEAKYFGKVWMIDAKKLAERRVLAFSYEHPFEAFVRTKKIVDVKTEMDLLYASVDNVCVWLGLLCPQVTGNTREEIITYGLQKLEQHADVGLVWEKDKTSIPQGFLQETVDEFVLVGRDDENIKKVGSALERLLPNL